MRKYLIKICTPQETALQTCIAPSAHAAWDAAWRLCEALLGVNTPPSFMSVKEVP